MFFDVIDKYLPFKIFSNSASEFFAFLTILILGLVLKRFISKLISKVGFQFFKKHINNTSLGWAEFHVVLLKSLDFFVLIVVLYFAFFQLNYPQVWNLGTEKEFGLKLIVKHLFLLGFLISLCRIGLRVIDFISLIFQERAQKSLSKTDNQLIPFFKDFLKVIFVILCIFFILGYVFKLNIASLVAGLGIGGLAIALAAKETLENLLGSFTIFLDKPFVVGDTIKTSSTEGIVEKIGFRSTRIRTPEKTYLTIPNKKLVDSELDNLSQRINRNIKLEFYVSFKTNANQIKALKESVLLFIAEQPLALNDIVRVKFKEFNIYGITISILFWLNSNDLSDQNNVVELLNLHILDTCQTLGIDFAQRP